MHLDLKSSIYIDITGPIYTEVIQEKSHPFVAKTHNSYVIRPDDARIVERES